MNYELNCNETNGNRHETLKTWLKKNNRIKVEYTEKGIIITNVCSRHLRRVRLNGDGLLKTIRRGKTTGLLTQGQNVFIEGKRFIVQKVA